MPHLQPYLTFNDETTKINYLYWSTKYSYEKTLGLLQLISDTSQGGGDPRVDQLWKSKDQRYLGATTIPLSEFIDNLNSNEGALRASSILNICSAFENAICGYFALCALYDPLAENSSCTSPAIPSLLKSNAEYNSRRKEILDSASQKLRGKYTNRLKVITKTWGLPSITGPEVTRLNTYYKKRHLIAHDQGIDNVDAPEKSSSELLSSRVQITEAAWKQMISDFNLVLLALDNAVMRNIVTDGGLALAIFRLVQRDGQQTISDLSKKLTNEWRMGNRKKEKIKTVALSIGLPVKQSFANVYTIG